MDIFGTYCFLRFGDRLEVFSNSRSLLRILAKTLFLVECCVFNSFLLQFLTVVRYFFAILSSLFSYLSPPFPSSIPSLIYPDFCRNHPASYWGIF